MKASIEFDLPEENIENIVALRGMEFALFILKIKNELHGKAKHAENFRKWEKLEELFINELEEDGLLDILNSIP